MTEREELEAALQAQDALVKRIAQLHERNMALMDALERYQALFFGRHGNLEHMGTEEFRAAHLRAFLHAADLLKAHDVR